MLYAGHGEKTAVTTETEWVEPLVVTAGIRSSPPIRRDLYNCRLVFKACFAAQAHNGVLRLDQHTQKVGQMGVALPGIPDVVVYALQHRR